MLLPVTPSPTGATVITVNGNTPNANPIVDTLALVTTGLTNPVGHSTGVGAGNLTSSSFSVNNPAVFWTRVSTNLPNFTSANNVTVVEGNSGSFTVAATGTPTPTLSLSAGTLPTGFTFNPTTGVVAWPANITVALGMQPSVTFTATNSVGSVSQTFTITVDKVPAITSAASVSYVNGIGGTFTVTTTGNPAAALTTSALPAYVTFTDNGNGTGSLVVGANAAVGGEYITITATNTINGVPRTVTQNFTLTVTAKGTAPNITSANSTSFTAGIKNTFSVTATGNPTPTYSVTAGSLPSGVTLSPSGVLSGTPAAGTAGNSYPITITASNGVTPDATQSFTLYVTTGAPAFNSANTATVVEGIAGSFTVTVTGNPTPTLSLAAGSTLPAGFTFNPTTGVVSWPANITVPLGGQPPVTFTATNSVSSASQTFIITVDKVPAITSAASVSYVQGIGGTFTVTTTGYPAPTLTTSTLPSGVTFTDNGNGTGSLVVSPTAAVGGKYITITATNTNTLVGTTNVTQNFTLTVTVPGTETAPVITSPNSVSYVNGIGGAFSVTTSGYPAAALTTSRPAQRRQLHRQWKRHRLACRQPHRCRRRRKHYHHRHQHDQQCAQDGHAELHAHRDRIGSLHHQRE